MGEELHLVDPSAEIESQTQRPRYLESVMKEERISNEVMRSRARAELLLVLSDGIPFAAYKTTTILLDGKRVKLQLWDTSGQGRFCTIIRSYSRGAQGVLLVYDITNRWSFDGLDRWLKEVDEVAG